MPAELVVTNIILKCNDGTCACACALYNFDLSHFHFHFVRQFSARFRRHSGECQINGYTSDILITFCCFRTTLPESNNKSLLIIHRSDRISINLQIHFESKKNFFFLFLLIIHLLILVLVDWTLRRTLL